MAIAQQPQLAQRHHARPKWVLLAAVVIGLVLFWVAIRVLSGGRIEPALLPQKIDQIPNRELGEVREEKVPIRYEVIGSIQSRVPVMAASRVAARVVEVKVRAGDLVRLGQVLVTLDASDLKAQVAQAQGELTAAQAELNRATADHQRFSALFSRGSVTASENDAAEAAYRGAAGRVAQAHGAVEAARAGFAYATVRSPADGIVVERLIEPGDMAMPGNPLVRMYDGNALRVELLVPEDFARSIETGTPLDVHIDATAAVYHTQVGEIVPAADPSSRGFLVRAVLPSGQHLRPGMFARATFTSGSETTLTLPRDAVRDIGQLQTVRVVSGHLIETRMVSLGRGFGDRVEVLAGLHPGERVVLDGTGAENK
jgi:membrane fusion protein, multidrug efflux system